jgi:hypothetical protein
MRQRIRPLRCGCQRGLLWGWSLSLRRRLHRTSMTIESSVESFRAAAIVKDDLLVSRDAELRATMARVVHFLESQAGSRLM